MVGCGGERSDSVENDRRDCWRLVAVVADVEKGRGREACGVCEKYCAAQLREDGLEPRKKSVEIDRIEAAGPYGCIIMRAVEDDFHLFSE